MLNISTLCENGPDPYYNKSKARDNLFVLSDNLFIENLLSETSRTLSMDTHYPESMDDLADCDLEEESEEQLRHQQELVAQALEIEREFWNCD